MCIGDREEDDMRYLTTKEAAAAVQVSEQTIRRRIADGVLRWHNIGVPNRPRIRITEEDLKAWVESGRTEAKAS